jgi:hypothetical protein
MDAMSLCQHRSTGSLAPALQHNDTDTLVEAIRDLEALALTARSASGGEDSNEEPLDDSTSKGLAPRPSLAAWASFCDLPREIRDHVYAFVMVNEIGNRNLTHVQPGDDPYQTASEDRPLSIYQALPLLRDEILNVFHQSRRFILSRGSEVRVYRDLFLWLFKVGRVATQHIRHIELRFKRDHRLASIPQHRVGISLERGEVKVVEVINSEYPDRLRMPSISRVEEVLSNPSSLRDFTYVTVLQAADEYKKTGAVVMGAINYLEARRICAFEVKVDEIRSRRSQ